VPSIVAAAVVYFAVNSGCWRSGRRWRSGIASSSGAPNYFLGALIATVAVQGLHRFDLKAMVLLVAPLFLAYRLYKAYASTCAISASNA